jgi:predicted molibdopterin-dependent oxidoreductase YjgC
MTITDHKEHTLTAPGTAAPAVRQAATLTLTIDGQEVTCERGETILEAAQRVGIHIPTLCYEPRLPASAACRV